MKCSATLFSRFVSVVFVSIFTIAFALSLSTWPAVVNAQEQSLSDISVLKSGDEKAIPGGQITYTVIVTNGGPDDANNVVSSDPIPVHTTIANMSVSQGTVASDGTTVMASFGSIAAFESATLTLVLNVDSNTEPGTTITNTAIANSGSVDNDLTNNSASASTLIVAPEADLTMAKTGDETAPVGGFINYTVQVANLGSLDAANVELIDPIPAHTTLSSFSVSQGTVMADQTTVTASFGTIPVGFSATLFLTVRINDDTPRNTLITNTATTTTSTVESHTEDNIASAFTTVTGVFAGDLIISEFRLRGPGFAIIGAPTNTTGAFGRPERGGKLSLKSSSSGRIAAQSNEALDEFVEIYNNTDAPITVNTFDDSSGFAVAASDGIVRFVIPNGTVIPARGHFLGVNSLGYSLSQYPSGNNGFAPTTATGDATYQQDLPDNAGIALFRTSISENFSTGTRLDAVGSTAEINSLYKEGNGYPALNPQLGSLEYSFFRDSCGKGGSTSNPGPCSQFTPKDTDDNAVDFVFVDTDGTNLGAGQRLGAPGPENLTSPIQSNGGIGGFLLDSTKSNGVAPNRVRDLTPDPANNSTFGTLDIRRRIVNGTGQPVTRLRFRIIDISTFLAPIGAADLRARTSPTVIVSGVNDPATCGGSTPCDVSVRGLILETPPSQPSGGGFNSSLSDGLVTLQTPLADGESINVRFLLGVQQTGLFRVVVNIEALTGSAPPPGSPRKLGISTKAN